MKRTGAKEEEQKQHERQQQECTNLCAALGPKGHLVIGFCAVLGSLGSLGHATSLAMPGTRRF